MAWGCKAARGGLILLLAGLIHGPDAQAANITFGFTAEIDSVEGTVPVPINASDMVSGFYTFETSPPGESPFFGRYPQDTGRWVIDLGAITLETIGYEIIVDNDIFQTTPGGEVLGPFDLYGIFCDGTAPPCQPSEFPVGDAVWNASIALSDTDASTLGSTALILDPLGVNAFPRRILRLTIRDGFDVTTVLGTVGSLFVVPEPSTWLLLLPGLAALVLGRRRLG